MLCGLFFYYTKITRIISEKFYRVHLQHVKSGDVNHLIAGKLSEDAKALEEFKNLWEDGLKAAVNNHAEISNAKENTDTQSNGVKYSLKEYTEHQKENWKDSKQIIVYENENQLRNFIQKSLDGEYLSVKKKMYFGAISTDLAERIFNETGVDAENYNITISSNEIRKILLNSHGDEKKENLRGQRAITEDDILAIPKIIEEADFIELDRKKYDGKPIIRFIKTINGKTTVVSYVSQKKHDLGVQTMYSSIKKDSLVTVANAKALTETSETTSNTAIFNTTISQSDSDVNSSIRTKGENNTKFSLPETDRYVKNINDIYGYKIKQGIKVNEDLLELLSIYDKNAKVDTNGNVTIYHRTNADAAEKIRKTGIMIAKEDALFFSSEDNGYASDYGDTVITLKIPSTVLEVNDVFDGEVHFDLPLRYKNGVYSLNVSQYLKDTDTKFSLSEPVEEKGNLIAVHNIYTDKLVKSLKLGGFPMPSIAVIKSDMGHAKYGECSFVFDKSTIDPKADKRNKVYGGDVWSPTYPKLAYKANEKIADKARKKYYDLYERHGEKVRGMYRYAVTLEDALNSKDGKNNGGEQKMLDKLYDDVGMMQIYWLDHGEDVIGNVVKREEEQTLNEQEIALSKQLLSTFENRIEEIAAKNGENPLSVKKEFFNKYHDEVIEAFKKYYKSTGMSAEEAEAKIADLKTGTFTTLLTKALRYKNNKGIKVTETVDDEATNKAIRNSINQSEYKKWIDNLFKGAEEKSGIWNGKDFYTPSGKRRNFDALHYEETLENVVKVMRSEMNSDTLFA